MEKTQVSSSNIAAVGYEADSQTLEVEFNNGSTYQYLEVPANVAQELIDAPSVGKYLNTNIKGLYTYQRV